MYSGSQNRMRMRIFNVLDDVKRDHGFAPVVTRPAGETPTPPPPSLASSMVATTLGGGHRSRRRNMCDWRTVMTAAALHARRLAGLQAARELVALPRDDAAGGYGQGPPGAVAARPAQREARHDALRRRQRPRGHHRCAHVVPHTGAVMCSMERCPIRTPALAERAVNVTCLTRWWKRDGGDNISAPLCIRPLGALCVSYSRIGRSLHRLN